MRRHFIRPTAARLAPAVAFLLLLSACAGSEEASTPTLATEPAAPTEPAAGQESAGQDDADTASGDADTASGDAEGDSEASAGDDQADADEQAAPVENLFPDVDVLNIADGSTVNLAQELGGGDKATLLWFFAPH